MIQIYFIQPDGAVNEASAEHGQTLLSVAKESGIDGFTGECGGNGTCATCHCFIQPEHLAEMFEPTEEESAMLDFVATTREANSRLACQIVVEYFMDGLRVYVPDPQY
jgi:2Fe-2S ferredoxin